MQKRHGRKGNNNFLNTVIALHICDSTQHILLRTNTAAQAETVFRQKSLSYIKDACLFSHV